MQSKAIRALIVAVVGILLLIPSLIMAYAWGGTLNLEVATVATLVTAATARWMPRLKWVIASIAALLIAVPPYPYWTNWDESRGQYLHFFHGFTFQTIPVFTFAIVFALAILLFAVMFRSINKGQRPQQ
ncbi:MAG: hypothetical protein GX772_06965 [Alcaligenaceae bacterium]|nr:hypothetical protein [Alcaligenaceae bacterium]